MSILVVFTGPMKAGKSLHMQSYVTASRAIGVDTVVFQPTIDTRDANGNLNSRFVKSDIPTKSVSTALEIWSHINGNRLVAIDEGQLFDCGLSCEVFKLLAKGYDVAVAGLNLDYRGLPFKEMSLIIARANQLHRLSARCDVCGDPAYFTQRLHHGLPVDDAFMPTIAIDNSLDYTYQTRCEKCFAPPSNLAKYLSVYG